MIPLNSKEIPGFDGFYRADKDGQIWTRKLGDWRKLKPGRDSDGYHCVTVVGKGGKCFNRPVHRLVLEAFIGPRLPGQQARHFPDRSKFNNRLDNLQWGTPSENYLDRMRHGTDNGGDRGHKAKLTWKKVREIRRLYLTGLFFYRELGKRFGVSLYTIFDITSGMTWKE